MALRLVLIGRVRFLVDVPVFCIGAKADTTAGEATKVVAARPAAAAANSGLRGMIAFVSLWLVGASEYGTIDWPPAVVVVGNFYCDVRNRERVASI